MKTIILRIMKILGIIIAVISLAMFVFILGKNSFIMTQISSILFPMVAGYLLVVMVIIALLSILALGLDFKNRRKPKVSLIILTGLSVTALIFGGVEYGIEKNVVHSNGGKVTLLGESSISLSAEPDEIVTYANKDNQNLTISIYRNQDEYRNKKQPVYIYIHGGGWGSGDSESSSWLHRAMAKNGYVAFSINYRLATDDDPNWEKATEDIADAITWIKDHASEYGGDSNKILLSGESAGGQLALLYTGMVSEGKLEAPVPDAVCVMYPAIDMKWTSANGKYLSTGVIAGIVEKYIGGDLNEYSDRLAAVDPMNYINENFPPVRIIHGKKDSLVTSAGSAAFTDAINSAGGQVELVLIPFANHGINFEEVVSLMTYFAGKNNLGILE